jgi:hypothetical protein
MRKVSNEIWKPTRRLFLAGAAGLITSPAFAWDSCSRAFGRQGGTGCNSVITASGGGSMSMTVTDAYSHTNSFSNSWSRTFNVGAATSSDYIFIFIDDDNLALASTPSFTIGGVTATQLALSSDTRSALYHATGCTVSGGTVSVSATTSGSFNNFASVVGFVHGPISSTPTTASCIGHTNFTSPLVISGAVPTGGVGVAFYCGGSITGLPLGWSSSPSGFAVVSAGEANTGTTSESSAATSSVANSYSIQAGSKTEGSLAFLAYN